MIFRKKFDFTFEVNRNEEKNSATRLEGKNHIHAGKSLLRALILASTNPQYYKRLFID
jgi:hypothetical protein